MSPDDIREGLREQPFAPFRLHLSNGMHVDVGHPEVCAVGDEALAVAVYNADKQKHILKYVSNINVNVIEPISEANTQDA